MLGDFKAVRFRAFGVAGAEIDVDQAPRKAVGNLRAETIHVIVVAVDAHDARSVYRGVQDLGGFEVGGDKDARLQTLLGGLRSHGIREISGGAAAHGLEPKAACGRRRTAARSLPAGAETRRSATC